MVSNIFPKRRELGINYDWKDVKSTSGYVFYDLCRTGLIRSEDASTLFATAGSRMKNTAPGDSTNSGVETNADYTKIIDQDFDLSEYQLPVIIKGTAIVRMGAYFSNDGANANFYLVIRVRKWDGASETEIANTGNIGPNSTVGEYNTTYPITIPRTQIKKGEQLRVTAEAWARDTDTGNHQVWIGHWPVDEAIASSNLSAGNTRAVIAIPYEINE